MIDHNIFDSIKGVILDVDGTLYHQKPVRLLTVAMMTAHGAARPASMLPTVKTVLAWRKTLEALRCQSAGFDVGVRQLEATAAAVNLPPSQVKQIVQKWMFDYPLGYLHWFRRKGLVEFLRSASRQAKRCISATGWKWTVPAPGTAACGLYLSEEENRGLLTGRATIGQTPFQRSRTNLRQICERSILDKSITSGRRTNMPTSLKKKEAEQGSLIAIGILSALLMLLLIREDY